MQKVFKVYMDDMQKPKRSFSNKLLAEDYVNDMQAYYPSSYFWMEDSCEQPKKKDILHYIVMHNTKITDDFHTTDIICSFGNKDSAIDYVTDMNCQMKDSGSYNWFNFVEMEVL